MKIYLAMAELDDGNRSFERAYLTHQAAEQAAKDMVNELEEHMGWKNMTPLVEELDLVEQE